MTFHPTRVTLRHACALSAPARVKESGQPLPHLTVGDFNPATWGDLFTERRRLAGLRDLCDPDAGHL